MYIFSVEPFVCIHMCRHAYIVSIQYIKVFVRCNRRQREVRFKCIIVNKVHVQRSPVAEAKPFVRSVVVVVVVEAQLRASPMQTVEVLAFPTCSQVTINRCGDEAIHDIRIK